MTTHRLGLLKIARPPATWLVLSAVALSVLACRGTAEVDGSGRDVVVIVVDTLRADFVGVYGRAPYPATPELDRFAGRGVWLTPTWASAPWTPPSVMSLLTSLRPAVHGLELNGRELGEVSPTLPAGALTLAERLRGAGYQTLAVTAGGGVGSSYGFDRGFDRFFEPETIQPEDVESGVDRALLWLAEADRRPLLLFFHTYEVHQPNTHPGFEAGEEPADRARAGYASDLAVADRHLGRLLRGFDALRDLDRSVVVVAADHGENLHDRVLAGRLVDHGHHLHRELLEVPLIVVAPDLIPPRGAVAGPAMLLDVVPTVLALVGMREERGLQGRDLRSLILGRESGLAERELLVGAPLQGPTWDGLRTPEWVLLRSPAIAAGEWWSQIPEPALGLYDRGRDPDEHTNVAEDHPEVVAALARRLDAQRRADLAVRRSLGAAQGSAAEGALENLRSLGYLGGRGAPTGEAN